MGKKRPRVSEEVMGRVETLVEDRVSGAEDYTFSQKLEALVTLVETTPTDQQSVREAQETAQGDRPDEWPSRYRWPPETPEGLHAAIENGFIAKPDKSDWRANVNTAEESEREAIAQRQLRNGQSGLR